MTRELSDNGLALIKSFEGCRLTAYKPVSTEKYYTIGYGHYGADVTPGMTITQKEADNLLRQDCAKFVKHVNGYMEKYNFNQNQFDALVSFAYNVGSITKLTNSKKRTIAQISENIPNYNKSGRRVLNGLVKRRAKEKTLFDAPVKLKTNTEIAKEVLDGKWGVGSARKTALTNAGYNYSSVQAEVNRLLKQKM